MTVTKITHNYYCAFNIVNSNVKRILLLGINHAVIMETPMVVSNYDKELFQHTVTTVKIPIPMANRYVLMNIVSF